MQIWIDADACPRALRDLVYRASERTGIPVVLVANQWLKHPQREQIEMVQVDGGLDAADEHIIEEVEPGELVITGDIPLAAEVVERGATCLDFRGNVIDENNARSRLAARDILEAIRGAGEMTGGPSAFGPKDKKRFAGALDLWLEDLRKRG
jgi:uncharacterized protein